MSRTEFEGAASLNVEDVDRVLGVIAGMERELIESVSSAVQIQSVNPKYPGQNYDELVGGEGEVARFVAAVYEEAGCMVDLFAVEPGRENAVGVMKGTGGGKSLIFNGHIDTVPAGDPRTWKSGDPFSGRIDDTRIWGRGSSDMKAGVLSQAFAAKAIAKAGLRLRGDLILEAVVGEEVGDHECGTTAVIRRGYTADGAIVSEPSSPPYSLAAAPVVPGILHLVVTVRGKAAHASMRGETYRAGGMGSEVAVSAIDKGMQIFQALRQLEEQWGQSKTHDLFRPGFFSISPGVIVGRPSDALIPWIIPDVTQLEYAVWFPPDADAAEIRGEVEDHIARAAQLDPWLRANPPEIEWRFCWPGSQVDFEHPLNVAVEHAHELAARGTRFSGPPPRQGAAYVADTAWLSAAGIPSMIYGPGSIGVAHAADEYVRIDELVTSCRTYALLALSWCGYEHS